MRKLAVMTVLLIHVIVFYVIAAEDHAYITICEGKCYYGKSESGPWKLLKVGDKVGSDIYLKTDENSKLEVKSNRGVIRLAPKTVFKYFSLKKKEGDSVMLSIGSVWAKVRKVADQKKFEVKTKSAVAGVRGTVFSVTALIDESSIIKVYEGEVGVNNKPAIEKKEKEEESKLAESKKERKEIPPPFKEVTKKQWEEMIARAMQMIKVSADGDISEPIAFDLEEDKKDDWVAWNMSLDEKEESKGKK
ncbi:MAG: FecR family protein [Deltaproteobacteria bacterium]|nr:FecR family protein [Deltaproteobacteria bacterium]